MCVSEGGCSCNWSVEGRAGQRAFHSGKCLVCMGLHLGQSSIRVKIKIVGMHVSEYFLSGRSWTF